MLSNAVESQTITPSAVVNPSSTLAITDVTAGAAGGYGVTSYPPPPPSSYIILTTTSAHNLSEGATTTIASLTGAVASTVNGNSYSVHVIDATNIALYHLGTTSYVFVAEFTSYSVAAGTVTVPGASGGITLTASYDTFDSRQADGLFRLRHDIAGQSVATVFTSATSGASIRCAGTWRLTTRGTWTGTVNIEKSTDGGVTWTNIRGFRSVADYNVDTYGDLGSEVVLVRMTMTAYTSGTCNVTLTTDPFTQTGIVKIVAVASAVSATAMVLKELGAATATYDWAEGSWSEYRGFPACVAFAQDRLCFGGTRSEPQTVWETETGNYESFLRSDPLLDSDGITINLPSRRMNLIRSMVTLSDLMAFTSSSEFSISGGGASAAMTPTSIETKVHGYRGASGVDPVVIGNRAIVASPMGTVVRDIGYDFGSDGYTGDNISIMSSHFFAGKTVVEMAYAQEPDSLLWVILSDGTLLSLTYLREQEVLAWTEHETDGLVEAICTIPGGGYDEVWFVVKRNINGSDTRYIERLTERMPTTLPKDQVFLDCSLTYSGAATTTISGLGHLEGESVVMLGDGNIYPAMTVTAGAITFSPAVSKAHIGIPYNCDFETLNIEMPMRGGSMQGMFVQISKVIIRLINSRGGTVGPDTSSLDPIVLRTNEPLGSAENLFTGDAEQSLQSGYSKGGRIFIRQSDPLPITILAVIPVVAVGG